jgi:hypothetical protein
MRRWCSRQKIDRALALLGVAPALGGTDGDADGESDRGYQPLPSAALDTRDVAQVRPAPTCACRLCDPQGRQTAGTVDGCGLRGLCLRPGGALDAVDVSDALITRYVVIGGLQPEIVGWEEDGEKMPAQASGTLMLSRAAIAPAHTASGPQVFLRARSSHIA